MFQITYQYIAMLTDFWIEKNLQSYQHRFSVQPQDRKHQNQHSHRMIKLSVKIDVWCRLDQINPLHPSISMVLLIYSL